MKNLFTMLAAATMLTGCIMDEPADMDAAEWDFEEKIPVKIVVDNDLDSRISSDGTTWSNGDKIGVKIDGETAKGTYSLTAEGVATATTEIYWPNAEDHNVIAWYPLGEGDISLADQTNGVPYVLRGVALGNYKSSVTMSLNHQLSRVRANLSGDTEWLKNAYVRVRGYNIKHSEGTVAASGAIVSIVPRKVDADTWEASVPPAGLPDDFLSVTTNGITYLLNPNLVSIEMGKDYTFNLTVDKQGVRLGTITIKPWVNGGTENGTAVPY